MKKVIVVIAVLTFSLKNTNAQRSFYFGPSYTFGLTNIYSGGMGGGMMGGMGTTGNSSSMNITYGLKASVGAGVRAEYFLNQKWAMLLNIGYMQRGARFDMGASTYTPRYRLSYLDVLLGVKYMTKEVMKKSRLFFDAGVSQHTLLNAYRVNSYGAMGMMDDMQHLDWGSFIGAGLEIPTFDKDIIQLHLFYNPGFSNMMTGVLKMNGMRGTNILYGFQLNYLLGIKKSEPKQQ